MVSGVFLGGFGEGLQQVEREQLQKDKLEEQKRQFELNLLDSQQSREQKRRLAIAKMNLDLGKEWLDKIQTTISNSSSRDQASKVVSGMKSMVDDIGDSLIEAGFESQGRALKSQVPHIIQTTPTLREQKESELAKAQTKGQASATETIATSKALQKEGIPKTTAQRTAGIEVPDDQGATLGFGKSVKGRSLTIMADFAPQFAAGELNDEQERFFLSAVNEFMQPETFTDPDSGLVVTRRPELPDFVSSALEERGISVSGGGEQVPLPEAGGAQQQAAPAPAAPAQAQNTGGIAGPSGQPVPQTTEPPAMPTLPEDAQLPPPEEVRQAKQENNERTLAHEVLAGNVTGPIPVLGRLIARIPGTGIRAPEMTSAASLFPIMRNRLVKALQTNPRFAVTERQDIIQDLSIDPKLIDQPQTFIDRMVGIDQALGNIETEMKEVVTNERARVSGETRQHAMDTLQAVQSFREVMMPSIMSTREEAIEFVENNPSGTQFMAQDENGNWQIFEVE